MLTRGRFTDETNDPDQSAFESMSSDIANIFIAFKRPNQYFILLAGNKINVNNCVNA